jgi:hypothetical protein
VERARKALSVGMSHEGTRSRKRRACLAHGRSFVDAHQEEVECWCSLLVACAGQENTCVTLPKAASSTRKNIPRKTSRDHGSDADVDARHWTTLVSLGVKIIDAVCMLFNPREAKRLRVAIAERVLDEKNVYRLDDVPV